MADRALVVFMGSQGHILCATGRGGRVIADSRLLARVGGKLCYTPTLHGRRVALFLTKLYAPVMRPGFQALDRRITSHAPPPLRTALAAVDATTERLLQEARLVAQGSDMFVQTMTLPDS